MRTMDLIRETGSALDSNRGRSLLTVLGIVIGIAAVIAMTALIDGIKFALVGQLGLNRARLVYINCWPATGELQTSDLDAIADALPDYEYVTALASGWSEVTTGERKSDCSLMGVYPEYAEVMGLHLMQGTFFSDREVEKGSMVIVLDENAVVQLFGSAEEDVVGKTVHIGNYDFVIVGVVESLSMGQQQGFMPFTTLGTRVNGYTMIDQVLGYAREDVDVDVLAERTHAFLVDRFKIDEEEGYGWCYVQTVKSITDQLDSTMMAFQLLMTAVASISLVVGGIGIMNMMLTNVTERIREIGLRKALGARSSDITRQFLLESVTLCIAGGIIGILAGYGGAWALAGVASSLAQIENVVPIITPASVGMATGICVGIGILFGYYPARRAAKLNPVESLRYQ